MNSPAHSPNQSRSKEAGVALLISLFVLLLVCAIAVSMMMSSGTESSLSSNYRSSTSAYYAAIAGLEEARGRLLTTNPSTFTALPNFIPAGGLTVPPVAQVRYILNPAPGEVVAPMTPGNAYYDNDYGNEFGVQASAIAGTAQTTPSVSNAGNFQGPMFKWVRITGATEASLGVNVDSRALPLDNATPLYYDPAHLNLAGAADPSLIDTLAPPSTAQQAYEIASLAVLPNGTKKMLEYTVAPVEFNLNLQSPLTMPGTVGSFSGGNSVNYQINGNDGKGTAPAVAGCNPNGPGGPSVAVSDPTDATTVKNGFPRPANYTGTNCSYFSGNAGCVGNDSLPPSMDSPSALQQTLQTIAANSNVCLTSSQANGNTAGCTTPTVTSPGPKGYTFSQISSSLPGGTWTNPATNPQVVYVDGDLDISASSGSGILVVTGNLTYDGNSNWNGIIMVVGEGTTTFNTQFNVNGGGSGQFNGAIFVATITHNGNGAILPTFGTADFNVNGGGGSGIFYNSCWINNVQKPITYQILSFKEIPQ